MMKPKDDVLKDEVEKHEQVEEDSLVSGFKELFLNAQQSSRQTEASFRALEEAGNSLKDSLGRLTDTQKQEVFDFIEDLLADPDLILATTHLSQEQNMALSSYLEYVRAYNFAREAQALERNLWKRNLDYFMEQIYPYWDWEKFLSFCAYSGGGDYEAEVSAIGDLDALTNVLLIYERLRHEDLELVDANDLVSMRRFMKDVHSCFSRWINMGFYNPNERSKQSELFAEETSTQELRRQVSSGINHLMKVAEEIVDFRSYIWRFECLPPLFLAILATWSNSGKLPRDESYLLALKEFLPGYVNYLKEIGFYPLDDREREDFLRKARSVGFVDLSDKIKGLDKFDNSADVLNSGSLNLLLSSFLNGTVPHYFLRFVNPISFVDIEEEGNGVGSVLGKVRPDGWVEASLARLVFDSFGNLRSAHIFVPASVPGISSDLFGIDDPENLSPEQKLVYRLGVLGLISSHIHHELGHVVYRTLDRRSLEDWVEISKDGVNVSRYVAYCREKPNSLGIEEDFTESFSMFTNKPWQLLSLSSSRFYFMLDMYRTYMDEESFSNFLRGVTSQTSNLIARFQLARSIIVELSNRGYSTAISLGEVEGDIRMCERLLEVLNSEIAGG